MMNAMIAGAETLEAPMKDWHHDVRAMAALVNDKTRMVCIANPTNPVGSMVPHDDIVWLLKNVPDDVLVVVDEAYHGYVKHLPDYESALYLIKNHRNLIVTRTFSKVYGLAALRLGFAVADPEIVRNSNRVRPPFNVNGAAAVAALAAIEDQEHVRQSVEANEAGKTWFRKFLQSMGADYVDPVANFFLLRVEPDAQTFARHLMERGVIVRPMTGYSLKEHVRVSIGTADENDFFAEAYQNIRASAEV
jgi:histidinol-phosphate aminotransferase